MDALQLGVVERDDLAARVAHQVMVMVVGAVRLVAQEPLTDLHRGTSRSALELVEDAVDRCPRDAARRRRVPSASSISAADSAQGCSASRSTIAWRAPPRR